MSEPTVRELMCPWCERSGPHTLNRMHDDGTEYRCGQCGRRHTRKDEDPDGMYVFFPGDIAAAFDTDLKPLWPEKGKGEANRLPGSRGSNPSLPPGW